MAAFDGVAFDPIAFDVEEEVVFPTSHGSSPLGYTRKPNQFRYEGWLAETEETKEMRLSEMLAQKLADAIAQNNAMMQVNSDLLTANSNLLGVVSEIKGTVVPAPKMEPEAKAILLQRLAEGKERKRLEAEAKAKEMRKRMAKVRKGKK